MNDNFPRIISMLRKERGFSQKYVASKLGVSQALLSHYEKGARECGLDFIAKTADFYEVSCDYLLGRTLEPSGKTISYDEISDGEFSNKSIGASAMSLMLNKKLIINSINVLFSLIQKTKSDSFMKAATSYIMLAIYKIFRTVFSANPNNDQRLFSVPKEIASEYASAAMSVNEAKAIAAAKGVMLQGQDIVEVSEETLITPENLSSEYATAATSLLNVVKNCESLVKQIDEE